MTSLGKKYDAIVVGSGATGSIAVKELTERGLEVLLVEAGRDLEASDFVPPAPVAPRAMGIGLFPRLKAAARGQHVQARRAFFNPTVSRFLVNDRELPYSTPPGQDFLWIRGRMLGGRLHTYGRMLLRMAPYDFTGGDGRDAWPLGYEDLAPWYDHVEEFIGIYGNQDNVAQLPDGKYRGPGMLTEAEQYFKSKVAERWPERNVVSWRYAAPNLDRVPVGIAAARRTGRLTTRTDAIVDRVAIDDKTGRASGVTFIDRLTREKHEVRADIVVLCASTIESVRLLLNSGTAKHPNGLGNSSGVLGRYFMDQTPSLTFGSIPQFTGSERDDSAPADPFYAPAGGAYMPRFENVGERTNSEFAAGFAFQMAMGRIPVPPTDPSGFGMMGFGEMLARPENRISLDQKRTDRWGIPVPLIDITPSENELAQMRAQVRESRAMVEYAGFRVNFAGSAMGLDSRNVFPQVDPISRELFRRNFKKSLPLGAAIHECGGARMGSTPESSVLNAFNQIWDIPNLLVTDASSYVTDGSVGPTLTIMALTARACAHIAEEYAPQSGIGATS